MTTYDNLHTWKKTCNGICLQ